jgi:hypothetical protein
MNRIVAVGVGLDVGVFVSVGVLKGVFEGGMELAVRVCAAATVCSMMLSSEPRVGSEGGGVTKPGDAQPKTTNRAIIQKVIWRSFRLFITHPHHFP